MGRPPDLTEFGSFAGQSNPKNPIAHDWRQRELQSFLRQPVGGWPARVSNAKCWQWEVPLGSPNLRRAEKDLEFMNSGNLSAEHRLAGLALMGGAALMVVASLFYPGVA